MYNDVGWHRELRPVALMPECNGNNSDMDNQPTLLEVIEKLTECLAELDRCGATVAAAHLSACLDALTSSQPVDS
jgi:hypothetical protein